MSKTEQRQKPAETSQAASMFDRVPPHDMQAERATLASIMLEAAAFDVVTAHISKDSFYADAHRRIWSAILRLRSSNIPCDTVTLAQELSRSGDLQEINGPPYLIQVLESVPHAAHAEYYAKIVREKARMRAMIDFCTESLRDAYGSSFSSDELFERVEHRAFSFLSERPELEPPSMVDAMLEWGQSLDPSVELPVLRTRWSRLDEILDGGFRGGQLCVLAARPSVGKSALAAGIARSICSSGEPGLFFSLEQKRSELIERIASAVSHIPLKKIRERSMDEMEMSAIIEAQNQIAKWPLWIDDNSHRTIGLHRVAVSAHQT